MKLIRESVGYYQCLERPMIREKTRLPLLMDSVHGSKIFTLRFKVIKPLHIGSGEIRIKDGKPIYVMQRQAKKVLIPGSSLKGAFRTYFELFFDDDYASRIFGKAGLISRVFLSDVFVSENMIESQQKIYKQFSQKSCDRKNKDRSQRVKIYKIHHCDDEHRKKTGKYIYAEVIKASEQFKSQIVVVGLDETTIANLFTTVGANPKIPFYINIGRGKEQGLGRVKVEVLENVNWEAVNRKLIEEIKSFLRHTKCGDAR